MGIAKAVLNKTDLKPTDDALRAFGKGVLEGAVDGMFVVGAYYFVRALVSK